MLLNLIVFITLLVGAFYLLETKLGVSNRDCNIMFAGMFGIGVVEAVAALITGVVGGLTGTIAVALLIKLLFNGALFYYFFNKTGL